MFHDDDDEEEIGVGADDGPDYYGPPRPGQSFAQYESFMSLPVAVGVGGAVVGALLLGPIGAIALGAGGFFASSKKKNVAKAGGY